MYVCLTVSLFSQSCHGDLYCLYWALPLEPSKTLNKLNAVLHPVEISCDSVALPLQYPLQMACLGLDHLHLLNEQELSPEILSEQPKDTKVNCHRMTTGTQQDTSAYMYHGVFVICF